MGVFDFLSNMSISASPLLPLVHTTQSRNAMPILDSKKLKTTECNVFDKELLLYFFYARPAYRKDEAETSTDKGLVPVCFILEPNSPIKRAYPFDTGAFPRYGQFIGGKRDNFLLPNDYDTLRKYITAIFGTNYSYFNGTIDGNVGKNGAGTLNFELNQLRDLISRTGKADMDDRCFTVEIQSECEYDLTSKLLAVVVPNYFYQEQEFVRAVSALGAKIKSYNYYNYLRVNEYVSTVYDCVRDFYYENNILQGAIV